MKKFILFFIFILLFISPSWSATWYVRDGGGSYGSTLTKCNGLTNTVFTGANGPNCAVNDLGYILGWGCYPGSVCDGGAPPMVGGDTLYIDGDSDTTWDFTVSGITTAPAVGDEYTNNGQTFTITVVKLITGTGVISASSGVNESPSTSGTLTVVSGHGSGDGTISFKAITGSQAQYGVGYLPGGNIWYYDYDHCEGYPSSNCSLGQVPAGSLTQQTSVIGTGTHKPQLYGRAGVYTLFGADNGYTTLQWLELTQHYSCGHGSTAQPCTGSNNYVGNEGLRISGAGVILTDVYVHGISTAGVNTGPLTNPVFTRLWVIGNSFGGMDVDGETGAADMTGTLTWNQPIIDWNGCIEQYPLLYPGIENPLNYKNCYGAANGGYGDGLPFGAAGSAYPGSWTIIGPGSISWNTQDGLDLRHGSNAGTVQVDKMRFEGNAGQQIKLTGLTDYVTNSLVIGDCGWWYGAYQTQAGAMNPDSSPNTGDTCRAGGNTISFNAIPGGSVNIYNDTIFTEAIALENYEGTCDSTAHVNIINSIIQGGTVWLNDLAFGPESDNSATTFYYNDNCSPTVTSQYNIVYGNKNSNAPCGGTGDQCATNPGFASGLFLNGTGPFGSGATINIVASGKLVTSGTIASGGSNYHAGDGIIPIQSGGTGAGFTITSVNGSGAITGIALVFSGDTQNGTYTTANNLPTQTGLGQYAWYNGFSGITLLPLAPNSPAVGAGVTGESYWDNSNDYNNTVTTNPPPIGGLNLGSCAANAYGCFFNSDCCSGSCSNQVCTKNYNSGFLNLI